MNYKSATGSWEPIDSNWVAGSAGSDPVQNGANSWHVKLPHDLSNGDVDATENGQSFGFGLSGAGSTVVSLQGTHATYRGAFTDATVAYQAQPESVKESITLTSASAPSTYTFPLDVPAGWTPKLVNGNVEFVDHFGRVARVAISAPMVTDASQKLGGPLGPLTTTLTDRSSGWMLKVAVSQSWLDSADRVFPVTIDPTLDMNGSQTDCMISNATPNTSYCSTGFLDIGGISGYSYNALLNFGAIPLPTDAQVNTAAVALDFGSVSAAVPNVAAFPLTADWNSGVTWNASGTGGSWRAGGYFGAAQDTETIPASGGYVNWYLTGVVQAWVDGVLPNRGIELGNDSDNTLTAAYSYASGTNVPSLNILWTTRVGEPAASPMVNVPVNDGMNLDVNAANGNGELSFPGFDITGTGLDMNLAVRDSTLNATSSVLGQYAGPHMTFQPGPALQLVNGALGGGTSGAIPTAVISGPDGATRTFTQVAATTYQSPGFNAVLSYLPASGSTPAYWYLQENDSGEIYAFSATPGATYGLLLYDETRDGEYITYNWSLNAQGTAYLSSIVDTQGRTITPTYGGPNGAVSAWTDSTGRTVSFGFNSLNEVSSITDPMGHVIQLGYDATNGEVNQITDPDGDETTLSYDGSNRITNVTNVSTTTGVASQSYGFNYLATVGTECTPSAGYVITSETAYTDPDGNTTRFCDDDQDRDIVTQDAAGDTITRTYNYADVPLSTTITSAGQTYALNNTTYESYAGQQTAEPTSSTTTGTAGSSINITAAGGSATYGAYPNEFLPDTVTDPQGNVTHYYYDAYGDITSVVDPLSASNTINLTYTPGHFGWVASSSTPDGVTTGYGYDAQGNLTSITPPATQSTVDQQTFAYDGLSRRVCAQDDIGNMTISSYNADDQPTTTRSEGIESSNCRSSSYPTTDGSVVDSKSYDDDGNLTNEVFAGTIASETYNSLGELSQQVLPTGQSITYTYDGDGNLASLTDGNGTYHYSYNDLEQLQQITEPNGNITTFAYNAEGQRIQVNYPNGIIVYYSWDAAGRLYTMAVNHGTTSNLGIFRYSYVSGTQGANSGDLLMNYSATIGSNQQVTGYIYDQLDRLSSAATELNGSTTPITQYGYSYDGDGNMVSQTANGSTTNYGYSGDQQTCANYNPSTSSCASGAGETSDPDGDVSNLGGPSLTFNAIGQPASEGGVSVGFFGLGEDDQTSLGNVSLQNTQLGLTASSQSGSTNYYTLDNDGNPLGQTSASNDYYYITNPVNNTVMYVTDSSGNVIRSNTYSPYGSEDTTGTGPNDIGWDGTFTQPGWGVYHFGSRQYTPGNSRWTQPDPAATDITGNPTLEDLGADTPDGLGLLTDPTQADPYVFGGDDPVNTTDPTGNALIYGDDDPEETIKDIAVDIYKGVRAGIPLMKVVSSKSLSISVKVSRFLFRQINGPQSNSFGYITHAVGSVLHHLFGISYLVPKSKQHLRHSV